MSHLNHCKGSQDPQCFIGDSTQNSIHICATLTGQYIVQCHFVYIKKKPYVLVHYLMYNTVSLLNHIMAAGFIATYAISAYHNQRCELESRTGEVYSMQHYVKQFVSDLRQVGGFLRVFRCPPPKKLTTMILLKYCLKSDNHHTPNMNSSLSDHTEHHKHVCVNGITIFTHK